jgi:transposase InsO family protein
VQRKLKVSERRACLVLGQARTTQRRELKEKDDEADLVAEIIDLATRFGRYGYRTVCGLLRLQGWKVNKKRVERIWKQEGLKVPQKQPKRGRLWLNEGSCIRMRPAYQDHVWSYDFVHERTHNGRPLKILTLIDEYTRECLALRVERSGVSVGL